MRFFPVSGSTGSSIGGVQAAITSMSSKCQQSFVISNTEGFRHYPAPPNQGDVIPFYLLSPGAPASSDPYQSMFRVKYMAAAIARKLAMAPASSALSSSRRSP